MPAPNLKEASSYQGHDFVASPVAAQGLIKSLLPKGESEAVALLHKGPSECPIDYLIADRQYGLHRLIAEGINMEHFLHNGYGWKDLQHFADMKTRPRDALMALGCNAEHFRQYPHLLPVREMPINGRAMVEYFGLEFAPNNGPVQVFGGSNTKPWNAKDLIALGISMQDLIGMDIRTLEQYIALQATDEDEVLMGVQDEHLERLERPQKVIAEEAQVAPVAEPQQQPLALPDIFAQTARLVPLQQTRRPRTHGLRTKK